MGMFDYVKGVPQGHSNQVKLWDCALALVGVGDEVPEVGGADTYSVRLEPTGSLEQRFIHVRNGRITEVGSPQHYPPTFDKWGGRLDLEETEEAPSTPPEIVRSHVAMGLTRGLHVLTEAALIAKAIQDHHLTVSWTTHDACTVNDMSRNRAAAVGVTLAEAVRRWLELYAPDHELVRDPED